MPALRRALLFRIGALGDVLLTRRLTYSLFLAGLRSTLFAPARHASVLLADPWIEGLVDAEHPDSAPAFAGHWPRSDGGFEVAAVISGSVDLVRAAQSAATSVIQIPPGPWSDDVPIGQQWSNAMSAVFPPFAGSLPLLPTESQQALVRGATLIHPGSGSANKNWPVQRFVELNRSLKNQGHRMVWVRGPAEADFPTELSGVEVLNRPSLRALGATLAQSRLFIGNDSGVSHLAAAVGAPTVVIYGPTSDLVWRPDGPRLETVRSASGALDAVKVEAVLAAIQELTRLRSSRE